jgi:hypothetical protein
MRHGKPLEIRGFPHYGGNKAMPLRCLPGIFALQTRQIRTNELPPYGVSWRRRRIFTLIVPRPGKAHWQSRFFPAYSGFGAFLCNSRENLPPRACSSTVGARRFLFCGRFFQNHCKNYNTAPVPIKEWRGVAVFILFTPNPILSGRMENRTARTIHFPALYALIGVSQ